MAPSLCWNGMIRRKSASGRSTEVSTEENKRISWRLQEEVFGQGNLKSIDELLAPDYVSHAPGDPELSRGPEDIKEIVRAYHSAFPNINFAVEKQVAEGDMVVTGGSLAAPIGASSWASLPPEDGSR